MYEARGNQIFINDELFITIHPTEPVINGTSTIAEQAKIIADMLNELD